MIELHDELAIRDLNARYIDAVNRVDASAWRATWAADGLWKLMGTEVAGRDAIAKFWQAAMSQFQFVVMALNSGTLTRQDGVVSGRWYVTEHLKALDGSGRMVLGVYQDRYASEAGEWKFAQRVYHVIYQTAHELSGTYQKIPT